MKKRSLLLAALTGGGLFVSPSTPAPAAPSRSVVIEDFERYTTDAEVAKAWYRPPHGGALTQTLGRDPVGAGRQALRVAYTTTAEHASHYCAFCRVSKWDLSGTTAVRFWFKPDGSGRTLTFQLNIANAAGRNIHDLWETRIRPAKGDTAERLVTIPYAQLAQNIKYADSPDVSPVFKPEAVIEVAFYIGGRDDAPGSGVYMFDEIVAVP